MAGWINDGLAKGELNPEQARTALADLGRTPAPPVADTRSPEVKALDQSFPKALGSDFHIDYQLPFGEELTPQGKEFDASCRTWLSGAEFPKELGNSVVKAISTTLQATQRMTEAELENYGHTEFAKLQKVHGDKLEEKLRSAGRMIAELEVKRPGLKQLLQSKGIGDNAMVASLIIQQSERWHARRK